MKLIIRSVLVILFMTVVSYMPIKAESIQYETTTYTEEFSIEPRSSAVLFKTSWGLTKDECTLAYSFFKSTSGSVDITLQKENSNGTWTDIASKYHTFSFTTLTSASVPVSNLSAGTYRVKTDVYAVVAGTLYTEGKLTGTQRLY